MIVNRLSLLSASLLLPLLLAACGTPSATPTGDTGSDQSGPVQSARPTPGGTPAPGNAATPTLPAGQKPPRPVPDPAAVAAGAPLRATLLAQIDAYEREVAKCNSVGTTVVSCSVTGFEAVRPHSPELADYVSWYSFIKQCSSDGKGGYLATLMFIYSSPEELREPRLLDVYVSGTPWCGQTRPEASPPATPSAHRVTPNATLATPSGQRVPPPSPDPAAVAAGASLRATLLAQIDAYERDAGGCGRAAAPDCLQAALQAQQSLNPELFAYANWFRAVELCVSDGKGGYGTQARAYVPTATELRDASRLDLYVANTPWCGYNGAATQVSAFGGGGPSIPRPSTIPAVRGIIQAATTKSVMVDGRPAERAAEFAVGEEVYITYTALSVGPNTTIDLKLFRDGAALDLDDTKTTFVTAATYYGYYRFKPSQAGAHRIELYFNGETTPPQTVDFIVRQAAPGRRSGRPS